MQKVVHRPGEHKVGPFTIMIVGNPALESPINSGVFVRDPIMTDRPGFQGAVAYIISALFGGFPEPLLGDPAIATKVRVISLFDDQEPVEAKNALVALDDVSNLLVPRRNELAQYASNHVDIVDVVYAISKAAVHKRASAYYTSDDDARGGVPFLLDGQAKSHRHYSLIPGTIAQHVSASGLTAVHEFQHAISSYSNGMITDLYVDGVLGVNKRLRAGPVIPTTFSQYVNGVPTAYVSDGTRNPLGYPASWTTYHCDRHDPTIPAIMDDYPKAPIPSACLNDKITRDFVLDRVKARLAR